MIFPKVSLIHVSSECNMCGKKPEIGDFFVTLMNKINQQWTSERQLCIKQVKLTITPVYGLQSQASEGIF